MYVKTVSYKDFDGNMRKEDFLFNLTEAELTEWLMAGDNYTIDKVLTKLVKERNNKEIMNTMKDLICRSYGVKSLDGKHFVKNKEVLDDFLSSAAYSVIFMELMQGGDAAADFVNGIMPEEARDSAKKALEENPDGIPEEIRDYLPENFIKSENK